MLTTNYPMNINRFNFVRSIKDNDQALYAEKIFNQISFTAEQLADIKTLHRYATTLHRLDENSCNGWPTWDHREDLAWRARDEKKEASITAKVHAIAKKHGWKIELQGDPRGWPMKLEIENIDCSVLVNYH
jgi:hypothetical protein